MQRGALPAACLILAALLGAAAPAAADLPTRSPLAAVTPQPDGTTFVSRVDPVTLAPRGPRAEVAYEFHHIWAASPDGSQIAFSISSPVGIVTPAPGQAGRVGVRIIDVRRMRVVKDARIGAFATGLGWFRPDRLVVQAGAVLNPLTGQVLRRRVPLVGGCQGPTETEVVSDREVVFLSDFLQLTDASARVRTRSLRGLPHACGLNGAAVDREGRRLILVGGGDAAAEIDLRTLRATRRGLSGPRQGQSTFGTTTWIGGGRVAVARQERGRPRGVSVVDTRTWTRRMLDAGASSVAVAGSVLLAYAPPARGRSEGLGVRAYAPGGRLLFSVLPGTDVSSVHVAGRFAYAQVQDRVHVIDLRERRVVASSRQPNFLDLLPG